MLPDHEYHPLAVVDVVDETADTRSFVLDIPPGARRDVRVRGRAVLHVPGDDRRRGGRALLLDVELARRRRPVHDDGEARARRAHVELDERHPRARRHDRGDAPDRSLRAARRPTSRSSRSPGGSGITPVISIIKSALATTDRAIVARVRQPRRRLGDLRRRARAAARHSGGRLVGAPSPRCRARLPRRRAVRGPRRRRTRRRLLRVRPRTVHGHGRGRASRSLGVDAGAASSSSGSWSPSPSRHRPRHLFANNTIHYLRRIFLDRLLIKHSRKRKHRRILTGNRKHSYDSSNGSQAEGPRIR